MNYINNNPTISFDEYSDKGQILFTEIKYIEKGEFKIISIYKNSTDGPEAEETEMYVYDLKDNIRIYTSRFQTILYSELGKVISAKSQYFDEETGKVVESEILEKDIPTKPTWSYVLNKYQLN